MSASDEWFEYHLTPAGWVEGSEKIDFAGIKKKRIPADRVLTLRFHQFLSSGFSKMDTWFEKIWSHKDSSKVEELTAKFGNRPSGYHDYSER